ncbi:enhancer of polycomb-like-domain-containing protein [Umbelopsis sp. PMI_123]|nr:enhancer of polycomb-like-domain-containing protein [Umbelopsis sp. PMI_123]
MVSRFRVKKLSPKHPLTVYKESQLPDIHDAGNLQRAVPLIETGVDKDEEDEHDLQAAISAAQAAVTTGEAVQLYIPTPDASITIDDAEYRALYKKPFNQPSSFIKYSTTVEDAIGCLYDMDEDDDTWLKAFNQDHSPKISEDQFEQVMWEFESLANENMPFLSVDPSQIPPFDELESHFKKPSLLPLQTAAKNIYSHWKERRLQNGGKPISAVLRFEESGVRNDTDPYVCFRRRETKPVRKTRRTDQQSLEKLRKLRAEMETARNLLEMVLRREKMRKESLALEHTIFDKKCVLRDMQRQLGIKEDEELLFSKKKRKMSTESGSGATIKIPLNKLKRDGFDVHEKSAAELAILAEVEKRKEEDSGFDDITDSPYQGFPIYLPSKFLRNALPNNSISTDAPTRLSRPSYRKRMGRGGRMYIDRIGFGRNHRESVSGKTKPLDPQERAIKRFKYDSDEMTDDEDYIDDMQDRLLRHQCQLLTEPDLRSLVTIPFINPSMTYPPGGMMANRLNTAAKQPAATVQRTNATATSPSMTTRPLNGASTSPLRRQNSRTKLTPQQQALATTNGMIAANMAAAVNAPNKASLQLAMQQQLQQQLQASGGNLPANMQAALQKKIQAAALMQQQQQQQQQRAAAASTNGNGNLSMSPIQQANMLKPNGLGNGQNGAMNLKLPNRPNNMMQQAFNAQQQQGGSSNAMNLAQTAASQASTVLQQVASLRNQAVNGTSPVMMNGMQAGSPLLNGSPQFITTATETKTAIGPDASGWNVWVTNAGTTVIARYDLCRR